jgi:hypothetical protein
MDAGFELPEIPSYEDLHSLGPLGTLQPPHNNNDQQNNDQLPVQYLLTAQQLQEMIDTAVSTALRRGETRIVLQDEATMPLEHVFPLDPSRSSQAIDMPGHDSSAGVPRPLTFAGTRIVETRYIPTKSHRTTSVTCHADIVKLCISPSDMDKHYKLSRIHIALKSTGLLSMLLRHRKKPVSDDFNIYGYVDRYTVHAVTPPEAIAAAKLQRGDAGGDDEDNVSVQSAQTNVTSVQAVPTIVPSTTIWHIDNDDVQNYDNDMSRLFSLVTVMFHTDYHCHASMESEFCEDAINFYESITKVAFGHRPRDVIAARQEFFQFKLNTNKSIQSEFQRWE